MSEVIVFQPSGMPVAIMRSAPEAAEIPLVRIGQHGVPEGLPFWIIDSSDIPEDRQLRNAWEIDTSSMGGPSGVGDLIAFTEWYEEVQRSAVDEGEES